MTTVPIDDAMFLIGEKPGKPAHVVALQFFEPPPSAGDEWAAAWHEQLLSAGPIRSVFRKTARASRTSPTQYRWADDGLDLDYHVRRTGLPRPGRMRDLLELVSFQHGTPLDRDRPLWDFHVIEGLQDGRVATTFKTHHSLADGISLATFVLGGLSPDPDARGATPPWVGEESGQASRPPSLLGGALEAIGGLTSAPRIGARTVQAMADMMRDTAATVPFEAPSSILNSTVTGARRFVGDRWDHSRFKKVATRSDCSVNDVVLAVCGGALRAYLEELDALPTKPLIAMVPVSLRRVQEQGQDAGNAFGAILCDIGTTTEDPASRLGAIAESMRSGKERMSALRSDEAAMVSRLVMGGAILSAFGISTPRQPFNLIISNVPASPVPLFYDGARLSDIYPMSMISEGQALNITVVRYVDKLSIGMVGDRKAVPHLQRMLGHLEASLAALEHATA